MTEQRSDTWCNITVMTSQWDASMLAITFFKYGEADVRERSFTIVQYIYDSLKTKYGETVDLPFHNRTPYRRRSLLQYLLEHIGL